MKKFSPIRLLAVLLSIAAASGLAYVLMQDSSDSIKQPKVINNSKGPSTEPKKNNATGKVHSLVEVEELPDIEWSYCLDNLTSDGCMEAVDPLFHEAPVLGDLTWVQLFDNIDTNISTLTAVLADPACAIQRPETYQPTHNEKTACGAEAFAELGVLAQRCGRSSPLELSRLPSAEARVQHAELAGETDLNVIHQLEQSARMAQLEHEWLRRRCANYEQILYNVPNILPQLNLREDVNQASADGFGPYAGRKPWRWNSEAYIEQAMLLGDYRVASAYVSAANLMTKLLGPIGDLTEVGQDDVFQLVKIREDAIENVIDDIIQNNPAIGFAASAEHLALRYPSLDLTFDYTINDIREANESPYRDKNAPILLIPEDNWYQRALDFATYQIAADRLAGIPDHYRGTPLQSANWQLYSVGEFLSDHLSANDWEYASQRANELIKEVSGP